MWGNVCLKCWKSSAHPDGGMLWTSCLTCSHCGHHKCGAEQNQLGQPCLLTVEVAQ